MVRVPVEGRACHVALVRVVIRKEQDTCSRVTGHGTARLASHRGAVLSVLLFAWRSGRPWEHGCEDPGTIPEETASWS